MAEYRVEYRIKVGPDLPNEKLIRLAELIENQHADRDWVVARDPAEHELSIVAYVAALTPMVAAKHAIAELDAGLRMVELYMVAERRLSTTEVDVDTSDRD